jgi:SAM-dependent methyltransferase
MDNSKKVDYIIQCMAASGLDANIQRVQTTHRLKLAEFWGIKEGSRVLEIGCGQGDTTAVLAYLVGEKGMVHGIDIASPDYGAPLTLGHSMGFLQESDLGSRVKVDFEFDILSNEVHFPDGYFDFVILSHSSWYLDSFEELRVILKVLKKWGNTLCYAEWDTRIKTDEQVPHFLSILIQAQYECFKKNSFSNVRTLFTPMDAMEIAGSCGWNVVAQQSFPSSELQDAEWEIAHTLNHFEEELASIKNMPMKLENLIRSEIKLLGDSVGGNRLLSMSTYSFVAR